jgi:predicted nucleic acid-binding protein
VAGLTLDAGALIAIERGDRTVIAHLKEALARGVDVTTPTVVVAEVWRGGAQSARMGQVLHATIVEPLGEKLARIAGEAIARVKGATVVDAIVMASAAARGDRVLTSDYDDLTRLSAQFPNVRIMKLRTS